MQPDPDPCNHTTSGHNDQKRRKKTHKSDPYNVCIIYLRKIRVFIHCTITSNLDFFQIQKWSVNIIDTKMVLVQSYHMTSERLGIYCTICIDYFCGDFYWILTTLGHFNGSSCNTILRKLIN